MAEVIKTFPTGPYLAAALICERVLTERDGVHSLVRIVDRTIVESAGPERPQIMPEIKHQFWLFLAFKSGEARGPETVKVTLTRPDGLTDQNPVAEQDVNFEGGTKGSNLIIEMRPTFKLAGPYWFNVYVGDEPMTKVPYEIVYTHRRTSGIKRP